MKQMDLMGNVEGEWQEPVDKKADKGEEYVLKSALQKAVRRGKTEKAMYYAWKLAKVAGGWTVWQRLLVIAVEDVGQPTEIVAVDTLYRQYLSLKRQTAEALTWDMLRTIVCAAKILAEAKKDRRADAFLELVTNAEQDKPNAKKWIEELAKYDDEVFDVHTLEGKRRGRGDKYWIEESSNVTNSTEEYKDFEKRWKEVMLADLEVSKK
jgi:hypothetical protein